MLRIVCAAAMAVVLSITGIFGSPAVAAGTTTWHVQAGSIAFGPTGPVGGGNRFYPASIAIHPGDKVAFTPLGAHTITYNRPPVRAIRSDDAHGRERIGELRDHR